MNIISNSSLGKTSTDAQIAELKKAIKTLSQQCSYLSSQVDSFSDELNSSVITANTIHTDEISAETIAGTSATVTALTANAITSETLTADSIDVETADIDAATISELNVTELATNELDSNSVTANISIASPLGNITSLQSDTVTSDSLETVEANIENATMGSVVQNGDIYFPKENSKIYGEYLDIECQSIKMSEGFEELRIKHLSTPDLKFEFDTLPVISSQVVGYNEDGKAIPVRLAEDYTLSSKWSENEKRYIFPNFDFKGITIPQASGALFNAISVTPKKDGIRRPELIIRKYIEEIIVGAIFDEYKNIPDFYCSVSKKFRNGDCVPYKYEGYEYAIMRARSLEYDNIEVLHLLNASRMDAVKNDVEYRSYHVAESFGDIDFEKNQEVYYEQKGLVSYIEPEDITLMKEAYQEHYDNIIGYNEDGDCYRWNGQEWELFTPSAGETNLTFFREVYRTSLNINEATIGKTYGPNFVSYSYDPINNEQRTVIRGEILLYGEENHYINIVDTSVVTLFDTFDKLHDKFTWTAKFATEADLPSNEYMVNWRTSILSTAQNCAYTEDGKRWTWVPTAGGWTENYDIDTTKLVTYFTASLNENTDIEDYTNYPEILDGMLKCAEDGDTLWSRYGIMMWDN